jgi:secondary thiamine-phosphate synthase enzyme
MAVATERFGVHTRGDADVVDITDHVQQAVDRSGIVDGVATVFIPGSTAGISTVEYEPGLQQDLPAAFERIAPRNIPYAHDATWHDGNGHAHVRSSLVGTSLSIPFENGSLILGTWQQVILLDFDNRPRSRKVVVQIIGERR